MTQVARSVAKVRSDAHAMPVGRDSDGGMRRIVGDAQRFDDEGAQHKRPARNVRAHLDTLPHAVDRHPVVRENRSPQSACKRVSVRGMVAMLMGDDEADRRAGRHQVGSERPHALDRAGGSKSSVDKQPFAFRLDDEAVAARPTPQDEHAQRAFLPCPCRLAEPNAGWPSRRETRHGNGARVYDATRGRTLA
jgi:hypothetical protein